VSFDLRLNQRLDLSLKLAPQIIQSIELLQLPAMDLKDVIEAELDTNEFLEIVPKADARLPYERNGTKGPEVDETAAPADGSGIPDRADGGGDPGSWNDAFGGRRRGSDDDPGQNKIEAMNNTASDGPTLQESVLAQYRILPDSDHRAQLAEQIIFNLDDNGYLSCPLEDVLAPIRDKYTLADAEAVLRQIQSLEPKGVAARDIAECLLLQLDPTDPDYPVQRALLQEHFEDLSKNRLPKVARALDVSIEKLKDLLHALSHLSAHPGQRLSNGKTRYINPDLLVEWNGDDYDVRLANEYIPELRLAPEYKLALQAKAAGRDYHDYVKKKVDSARAFIMAVEKRQKTLLDVGRAIVRHQREFLDFGPHYLRPLKMQQVAEDLGIHVSTVSRAASGKSMQTHRGIFALKDFFTGGTASIDGGVESRESVKQKVKEIVSHEDRANPLSDDDIVARLLSIHGIKVARRTVTKYRKALRIASSRQRKSF
jgi:RNA polymerase sigma-54 factor